MHNKIYDYEQVMEKLNQLVQNSIITEEKDIGKTKYGLPIKHYSIGKGKKSVVISSATHGCEIISTDFVLKLMEEMSKRTPRFNKIDFNKYKFHFIPILNPEGYLISTSAIRAKIPSKMPEEEAEKICKEYYQQYKNDDIQATARRKQGLEPDRTSVKLHQKLFEDVDYTCIPKKYKEIREKIKSIYEKYPDLPVGMLQAWSANADGIDIQANCILNDKIRQIEDGDKIYKDDLRHSNIDISHPGPINVPYDKEVGFEKTREVKAIEGLLEELQQSGELVSYYNYHSTGGMIYQRPASFIGKIDGKYFNIDKKIVENYLLAKIYSEKTYKNASDKSNSRYAVQRSNLKLSSSNDLFRIKYPEDFLIEISGMGGNPLGPYGDIQGNYNSLMKSNLDAFAYSIKLREIANIVSNSAFSAFENLQKKSDNEEEVQNRYEILDVIFQEFMNQVEHLKSREKEENSLDK